MPFLPPGEYEAVFLRAEFMDDGFGGAIAFVFCIRRNGCDIREVREIVPIRGKPSELLLPFVAKLAGTLKEGQKPNDEQRLDEPVTFIIPQPEAIAN